MDNKILLFFNMLNECLICINCTMSYEYLVLVLIHTVILYWSSLRSGCVLFTLFIFLNIKQNLASPVRNQSNKKCMCAVNAVCHDFYNCVMNII